MAHYKRGRCRYNGKYRTNSATFYRTRHGLKPYKDWQAMRHLPLNEWMAMRDIVWPPAFNMNSGHPRAWDILYHTRPRRTREKRMANQIVKGTLDADDATWPLLRKPTVYYW